MLHDRFAGNAGKVKHFGYIPALSFGIGFGARQVVFRTFASGLIFGRNANPNPDILGF